MYTTTSPACCPSSWVTDHTDDLIGGVREPRVHVVDDDILEIELTEGSDAVQAEVILLDHEPQEDRVSGCRQRTKEPTE